jgi:hypothetical protein
MRDGARVKPRAGKFLVSCGLAAVTSIAAARSARAGEGESALSVGAGYASYLIPGLEDTTAASTVGGYVALEYERTFGEAWSVRADVAGGGFGGGGGSWMALVDGGVVYRFDVLKYVPYAFATLGVLATGGGPLSGDLDDDGERDCDPGLSACAGGPEPMLAIGGGLDVLRSREASWGIELRASSLVGDTTLLTVGARYTRRWGFF